MEMKHTPTPWKYIVGQESVECLIVANDAFIEKDDYAIIAQTYGYACEDDSGETNAAFIVRACNAHDELLSCLETLHARAKGKRLDCNAQKLYNRCASAIAKARGEA